MNKIALFVSIALATHLVACGTRTAFPTEAEVADLQAATLDKRLHTVEKILVRDLKCKPMEQREVDEARKAASFWGMDPGRAKSFVRCSYSYEMVVKGKDLGNLGLVKGRDYTENKTRVDIRMIQVQKDDGTLKWTL